MENNGKQRQKVLKVLKKKEKSEEISSLFFVVVFVCLFCFVCFSYISFLFEIPFGVFWLFCLSEKRRTTSKREGRRREDIHEVTKSSMRERLCREQLWMYQFSRILFTPLFKQFHFFIHFLIFFILFFLYFPKTIDRKQKSTKKERKTLKRRRKDDLRERKKNEQWFKNNNHNKKIRNPHPPIKEVREGR